MSHGNYNIQNVIQRPYASILNIDNLLYGLIYSNMYSWRIHTLKKRPFFKHKSKLSIPFMEKVNYKREKLSNHDHHLRLNPISFLERR